MVDTGRGIRGEPRMLPLEAVEPNPWNPNVQSERKFASLLDSIRRTGLVAPITVRSGSLDGPEFEKKQILGGEHRWLAASKLGFAEIPVWDIGTCTEVEAMALTEVLNSIHGQNEPIKWTELIQAIQDADPALIGILPYSEAYIEQAISTSAVDWDSLSKKAAAKEKKGKSQEPRLSVAVSAEQMSKIKMAFSLVRLVPERSRISDADCLEAVVDSFLSSVEKEM